MKKFLRLLKKEIKELLTPEMIVPFILVMLIFAGMGKLAGTQIKSQSEHKEKILVSDLDNSTISQTTILAIKQVADVQTETVTEADFVDKLKSENITNGILIPENFGQNILQNSKSDLQTFSVLNDFSYAATKKYTVLSSAVGVANETISNLLLSQKNLDAINLKNPITAKEFVSANGKIVEGNALLILNNIVQQTTFIPIVLFIVITMAAQMIATAVAIEKENKTLETLLSLPVSRKAIVSAKMLAAGIVSLVMAGFYLYGMNSFSNGISTGTTGSANVSELVSSLGLKLSGNGYVELGLILFLGILLALAIAMILGAFSEDAKSAQGVISPLMVLLLIPYFATLFLDINQLPIIGKYLIYAIPFSHIFLAAPNILSGHNAFVWWGILYLFILFIVFVYIAAKIFSTDLILTIKLNFSKKAKK